MLKLLAILFGGAALFSGLVWITVRPIGTHPFVGSWIGHADSETYHLTLRADGAGSGYTSIEQEIFPSNSFSWHADGDYLIEDYPAIDGFDEHNQPVRIHDAHTDREQWSISEDGQRLTLGKQVYERVN